MPIDPKVKLEKKSTYQSNNKYVKTLSKLI